MKAALRAKEQVLSPTPRVNEFAEKYKSTMTTNLKIFDFARNLEREVDALKHDNSRMLAKLALAAEYEAGTEELLRDLLTALEDMTLYAMSYQAVTDEQQKEHAKSYDAARAIIERAKEPA